MNRFIPCIYQHGMFEGEYAVELNIRETILSLFVNAEDLIVSIPCDGMGLLRVRVQDKEKNIISLPSEILEQGRRYLQYPIDELICQ